MPERTPLDEHLVFIGQMQIEMFIALHNSNPS